MIRRFFTSTALVLAVSSWAWAGQTPAPESRQADVFVSGTEGYHTFRIPALSVTPAGTLLAFCEGRKTSRADLGNNDLMLKRSTDGGSTWGKLQLVYEEGGDKKITISNPTAVVDLLYERDNYGKITFVSFTLDWLTGGSNKRKP